MFPFFAAISFTGMLSTPTGLAVSSNNLNILSPWPQESRWGCFSGRAARTLTKWVRDADSTSSQNAFHDMRGNGFLNISSFDTCEKKKRTSGSLYLYSKLLELFEILLDPTRNLSRRSPSIHRLRNLRPPSRILNSA